MRHDLSSGLTSNAKREIRAVLSLGCDRETASKFVGETMSALQSEMLRDPKFAIEVRRAEAACEIVHMRNVRTAAGDPKNWRASVWWLERRAPERYARRAADAVTTRQLESFVALLVAAVQEEVRSADQRQRLLARLGELAETLDELSASEMVPPPPENTDAEDEPSNGSTW